MISKFSIIGTVRKYTYEEKGPSLFPVIELDVQTGEKWFSTRGSGADATAIHQVLQNAPEGVPVRVAGDVTFRLNKDGDATYADLTVRSVAPDHSGRQATVFQLVGFNRGVMEIPKKNGEGTFKRARIELVAADRTGVVPNAILELSAPRTGEEEFLATWQANEGNLAEVSGELSSWLGQTATRPRTQYNATSAGFSPVPAYMAAPVDEVPFDVSGGVVAEQAAQAQGAGLSSLI